MTLTDYLLLMSALINVGIALVLVRGAWLRKHYVALPTYIEMRRAWDRGDHNFTSRRRTSQPSVSGVEWAALCLREGIGKNPGPDRAPERGA